MRIIHKITGIWAPPALFALLAFNQAIAAQPVGSSYTVQSRSIPTSVVLGGTVIPAKEVTLSAQLPGRVNMIAGEEGDFFEKNTVLLSLDDAELLAQRRATWAEYASAQSTLRNAGVQYSRELWSPDSIDKAPGGMGIPHMFDKMFTEKAQDMVGNSDSVLDRQAALYNYSTKIEQARNSMLRAHAQIDAIDAKLRDAHSLSPFDGVITKKMVEVGDTVQPGMPLLKFADTKNLQIRVEVPARLVPGLHVGMVLSAKLDVGGIGKVKVAQIFPIADPNMHTVTVKFDLPSGVQTGPGQYAQVGIPDINTRVSEMPVIPRSALVWRGSLPSVYVLSGGRRELRMVRLGDSYGDDVTVLSGLQAGETIEPNPAPSTGWNNGQESSTR